jgi:hypothetical protein
MGQEAVDRAGDKSSGAAKALPHDRIATRAAPIDLSPTDHLPGWRAAARILFVATSCLLVAGLVVQVFLAGLGVFDSPERFELHASFGFTLMAFPLLMLLSGLAGELGRRLIGLSALIFALFFVQSLLVSVRADAPAVAALHPLDGFLILFLSITVARGSLARRRDAGPTPASFA